jgi:uridine kinase
VRAKVVVVAGPSGAGKSRLCRLVEDRLGLPTINLDDFYKDGSDPTLPRASIGPGRDIVDWDDPRSWLAEEAVDALERLCRDGSADLPVYELARDGRVGHHVLTLGDAPLLVAEGIFAQEVVAACAARGILADAVCVRNHPVVTFWRRLLRDLRERRKSPWVLVRRGFVLMRAQSSVVAHAEALGCEAVSPAQAFTRIEALVRTAGAARM